MIGALKRAFGTKGAVKQVAQFADDLHLSKEERVQYALDYLNSLSSFKVVQRIIVACVMLMWLLIGLSMLACIWWLDPSLEIDPAQIRYDAFLGFAQTELIWMPSVGVFTLYLAGGVIPKKDK